MSSTRRNPCISILLAIALIAGSLISPLSAFAADDISDLPEAVFTVYGSTMDRGVIAAKVSNGVFLGWRYFPEEATGVSNTGLVGADFAVFKNGEKLADVTDSTDYLDPDGTIEDTYTIVTVVNGVYTSKTKDVKPAAQTSSGNYLSIPLKRPPSVQVPANNNPTGLQTKNYKQDETTVGDVDGDGQLEFVIKWQADNYDVIQPGYCAPVIFHCYKLDGTLLWEINLGVNIRAGQHYSQPMLYDFDGDGKAEFMTKTAPGTKDSLGNFITMPQADIDKGYTHADDYRDNDSALTGGTPGPLEAKEQGKRFQWVVNFFKNWKEQGDVVAGYWKYPPQVMLGLYQAGYVGADGVAVEVNGRMGSYNPYPNAVGYTQEVWDRLNALPKDSEVFKNYTITDRDALDLAWLYWANIFDWSPSSGLNREVGYVIEGPEYFTVFDGETGKELDTIPYAIPRDDIGIMWNDMTTMNRNDRHLGAVAYLDGDDKNPSCLQVRGYYSRTTVTRYDWDGQNLTCDVLADTGYQVTGNPFRTGDTGPADPLLGPGGLQGNPGRNELSFDPDNPTVENLEYVDKEHFTGPSITHQGAHSMSVMDVDGDGFDEIILGNATLNHDGSTRYSTYYQPFTPGTSETTPTGKWEKAQHPDSMHVAYFDPEQSSPKYYSSSEASWLDEILKDADTGEVLYYTGPVTSGGSVWGIPRDNEWAMVGKFTDEPGWQMFSRARTTTPLGTNAGSGLRKADGTPSEYQTLSPGTRFSIFWSADLTTQIVNGQTNLTVQKVNEELTGFAPVLSTVGTACHGAGKGQPAIVADILGDYREELVLVAGTDVSATPELRIYFNTEESGHKMASLYTDRRYRVETSRQWTCYNQPTYPSFYYGPDMIWKVYARSIGVDVPETVTFDYNGGEGSVESKTFIYGEPYGELPDATRESYAFLGWSIDGTEEGIVTAETIVNAGGTLTAVWGEDFTDGKARVKLSGPAVLTVMDEAEYILSVANAKGLATVTVWLEVDGTYLNGKDALALNGFDTIGGVQWVNTEGTTWVGRVTLGNLKNSSLTADDYTDILSMGFGLKELGETTVKITKVTLSGYDEAGGAVFTEALIRNGSVDTKIVPWFSPYDVNKDGSIDQLDLTTAQKYYMAAEGDANWNEAKIADVDGSGKVDIEDFIQILNNIVW